MQGDNGTADDAQSGLTDDSGQLTGEPAGGAPGLAAGGREPDSGAHAEAAAPADGGLQAGSRPEAMAQERSAAIVSSARADPSSHPVSPAAASPGAAAAAAGRQHPATQQLPAVAQWQGREGAGGRSGSEAAAPDTAARAAALMRAIQVPSEPPSERQQGPRGLRWPPAGIRTGQPRPQAPHQKFHPRELQRQLQRLQAGGAGAGAPVHQPVSMGLVAAAVLSEGVCSHDPAATPSPGDKRQRRETQSELAFATPPEEGDASSAEEGGGSAGGRRTRRRMMWTPELHTRFMNAVNHLGPDRAVPKTILTLMNVDGLTRENVASHLQKYRAYLRRIAGLPPGAPLPQQQLPALQQAAMAAALQQHQAASAAGAQEVPSWAQALPQPSPLRTGFVAERQQHHQAAAVQATAGGEAGGHSLVKAPPIQPLDVSGGLATQVDTGRGLMGPWGSGGTAAAPPAMAYPGMLGLPQADVPAVGAAVTAGWNYPPPPPHLAGLLHTSGPPVPQPTLVRHSPAAGSGTAPVPQLAATTGPAQGASQAAAPAAAALASGENTAAAAPRSAAAVHTQQPPAAAAAANAAAEQAQRQQPAATAPPDQEAQPKAKE